MTDAEKILILRNALTEAMMRLHYISIYEPDDYAKQSVTAMCSHYNACKLTAENGTNLAKAALDSLTG